jgi:hypothetical protein
MADDDAHEERGEGNADREEEPLHIIHVALRGYMFK